MPNKFERGKPKPETVDEKDRSLAEYTTAMEEYQQITKNVRELERKHPKDRRDEADNFKIQTLDQDRHQRHLLLIAVAEKLGKTREDVLVDIIRWENSLEEYGLPEFSILKSEDIVDTQGFHSAVQFNIEDDRPAKAFTPLDKAFGNYVFGEPYYSEILERVIDEDEVLLVFAISPIEEMDGPFLRPDDYDQRVERAQALAKEVGGKLFNDQEGGMHATSAEIMGVVIRKDNLEKVIGTIRDNPEKFRLDPQFYEK